MIKSIHRNILVFLFLLIGLATQVQAESESTLAPGNAVIKKPPESIKDWYKPHNKRQVWLHTMFRLRREILAIEDYSQSGNVETQYAELLDKWFAGLEKDYLSIETMVPEWQTFLDKEPLEKLKAAIANRSYSQIPTHIDQLKQSCQNCHNDYQAITRLIYRSADFARIKVHNPETGRSIAYDKAMENLSNTVNRIKIAMHDLRYPQAISHLEPLQAGLKHLADGCQDCHKQPKEQVDYIINSSQPILDALKVALQNKDNKQARISLGTFAVKTCARCHSVHRTTAELKELIE